MLETVLSFFDHRSFTPFICFFLSTSGFYLIVVSLKYYNKKTMITGDVKMYELVILVYKKTCDAKNK